MAAAAGIVFICISGGKPGRVSPPLPCTRTPPFSNIPSPKLSTLSRKAPHSSAFERPWRSTDQPTNLLLLQPPRLRIPSYLDKIERILSKRFHLPTYPPPPGARSSAGRSRICRPFFFFSFFFPPQQARPSPPRVPGFSWIFSFLFFSRGGGGRSSRFFGICLLACLLGRLDGKTYF